MKPSERDELIRSFFEQDMELLKAKGHDYAGTDDCLANLKRFGLYGIIVRLSDKFSRLESLAKVGFDKAEVKSESIIDTLRDIRNYAFLAQIFAEGKDAPPGQALRVEAETQTGGAVSDDAKDGEWAAREEAFKVGFEKTHGKLFDRLNQLLDQFRVGDRVKVTGVRHNGHTGKVVDIVPDYVKSIRVQIDVPAGEWIVFCGPEDIEKI